MGLRSREVSARRVLAVLAAVLTLPWPLLVLLSALGVSGDPDAALVAIAAATVALIAAAPLAARWQSFPGVASALWLLLMFLGFMGGLAGGWILFIGVWAWPAATIPAQATRWRLPRVAGVIGGVLLASGAAVGLALGVADARDDPDLGVRLRPGASVTEFMDRAIEEPRVHSAAIGGPSEDVQLELVDGLTPELREDTAAAVRRDRAVVWVRIVD